MEGLEAVSQSRTMSLVEAAANNVVAFGISLLANHLVLPLFGLAVSLAQSFGITVVFTLISLVRSYLLRRIFVTLETREKAPC